MRVTIFDYGAGNLHSLIKVLEAGDRSIIVETDPRAAARTGLLVLPGVGAFAAAAARLERGLETMRDALVDGLPCIGICLGMQLLFEASDEGPGRGLGLIAGRVTPLVATRVPHIGWNELEGAGSLTTAWFANGYACRPADPAVVAAWTTHESDRFPAVVRSGRTLGVQFHPEKSSAAGVRFLRDAVRELAGVPA